MSLPLCKDSRHYGNNIVKQRINLSKEQLIIEYVDIIKYVAGRLSMYFGSNVEYDDLEGYGVLD